MTRDTNDELLTARIDACRSKVQDNARFVRWMLQLWALGQLVVFIGAQFKNALASALGGVAAIVGILGACGGWFRRYRLKSALARAEGTRAAMRSLRSPGG